MFLDAGDPRVHDWPLVKSPLPTLAICPLVRFHGQSSWSKIDERSKTVQPERCHDCVQFLDGTLEYLSSLSMRGLKDGLESIVGSVNPWTTQMQECQQLMEPTSTT